MSGRRFYKMSGSGNDFVVFDERDGATEDYRDPAMIRRLCDRRNGVGADGVVVIGASKRADVRMMYFNSDGSRGAMCGNAALCVTHLATQMGYGGQGRLRIETDDALVEARVVDGVPEVELAPVREISSAAPETLRDDERKMGYAIAGVPHIVVLCDDVERADVEGRGPELRRAEWTGAAGANVNFVSRAGESWAIRTFERGVEAETLACGTGTVATATLLREWGLSGDEAALRTRSGCVLEVLLARRSSEIRPTLRGEGKVVYEGFLRSI